MSNLAQKLLRNGFLTEAKGELEKAMKIDGFHRSVSLTLASLQQIPTTEDAKIDEVLEKVRPKRDYYQRLGRAFVRPDVVDLAGRWSGPTCQLEATQAGKVFRAAGTYEVDSRNPFVTLLVGGPKLMVKHRIEYEGTIQGETIEATVRHVREGDVSAASTVLGANDAKTKVLFVLNDGHLDAMENPSGASPTFYRFTRVGT